MAGLIETVSYNKAGFADKLFNVQKVDATLYKTFLIADITNTGDREAFFLQVIQIGNSTDILSGKISFIHIGYVNYNNEILAYGIKEKTENPFNFKFYTQGSKLYYQVNLIGGYAYFIGANTKVVSVELPEDAVEVQMK